MLTVRVDGKRGAPRLARLAGRVPPGVDAAGGADEYLYLPIARRRGGLDVRGHERQSRWLLLGPRKFSHRRKTREVRDLRVVAVVAVVAGAEEENLHEN